MQVRPEPTRAGGQRHEKKGTVVRSHSAVAPRRRGTGAGGGRRSSGPRGHLLVTGDHGYVVVGFVFLGGSEGESSAKIYGKGKRKKGRRGGGGESRGHIGASIVARLYCICVCFWGGRYARILGISIVHTKIVRLEGLK